MAASITTKEQTYHLLLGLSLLGEWFDGNELERVRGGLRIPDYNLLVLGLITDGRSGVVPPPGLYSPRRITEAGWRFIREYQEK